MTKGLGTDTARPFVGSLVLHETWRFVVMHSSTGEIEVGELEVRGHSQQAVEPTWTTSDSVSTKTIKESEGPQALHYTHWRQPLPLSPCIGFCECPPIWSSNSTVNREERKPLAAQTPVNHSQPSLPGCTGSFFGLQVLDPVPLHTSQLLI